MLEDIRSHSPLPDEQEIRWIAARPFQAAARVAILALVAILVANFGGIWSPPANPTVAAVATPSR